MKINSIKEAFYEYAKMELPVIPLCPFDHSGMSEEHLNRCNNPGKTPLILRWVNARVPSEELIDEWLIKWPNCNIGLVLGKVSGLIAIDVDGQYGAETLQKISGGDLPETWQFSTPGGGMRYLYRFPKNLNLKKFQDTNKELAHNECALLGEGFQTVMPPSTHQNGGKYEWIHLPQ